MKPIQYTKGWTEFYKLKFKVTPDVLIPRPETELLVDEILSFARTNLTRLTILDLGTGSGNIAISLAKNLYYKLHSHIQSGNVKIIATDISKKALKVAKQNAKFHKVEDKIVFIQSNLLGAKYTLWRNFGATNVIVTNLPYIPSSRIHYLDSSVKDYEPLVALDGGEDGFELYRKLFQQIKLQLRELQLKLIVGEIDYTHGEIALREANKFFPNSQSEVKTDLARKQRILIVRLDY